ncbi:MAG: hypothetical protein V1699_06305 [Candidatus Omnitrophota bacterium]
MSPYKTAKIEIGRLLLQKGLITSEQLKEALSIQRNRDKDKRLGQILIGLGYLSRDELCFALAIQSGYPYIDIKRCVIDQSVTSLIPGIMVKKYQVFPIDRIQDVITVAMVNPLDNLIIDQIQDIIKGTIKVFLTTPADLEEMISQYYGKIKD